MSDPVMTCDACGARRSCMLYLRADFPPQAARRWLQSYCEHPDKPCRESSDVIAYTAGVA